MRYIPKSILHDKEAALKGGENVKKVKFQRHSHIKLLLYKKGIKKLQGENEKGKI